MWIPPAPQAGGRRLHDWLARSAKIILTASQHSISSCEARLRRSPRRSSTAGDAAAAADGPVREVQPYGQSARVRMARTTGRVSKQQQLRAVVRRGGRSIGGRAGTRFSAGDSPGICEARSTARGSALKFLARTHARTEEAVRCTVAVQRLSEIIVSDTPRIQRKCARSESPAPARDRWVSACQYPPLICTHAASNPILRSSVRPSGGGGNVDLSNYRERASHATLRRHPATHCTVAFA